MLLLLFLTRYLINLVNDVIIVIINVYIINIINVNVIIIFRNWFAWLQCFIFGSLNSFIFCTWLIDNVHKPLHCVLIVNCVPILQLHLYCYLYVFICICFNCLLKGFQVDICIYFTLFHQLNYPLLLLIRTHIDSLIIFFCKHNRVQSLQRKYFLNVHSLMLGRLLFHLLYLYRLLFYLLLFNRLLFFNLFGWLYWFLA